MLSDTLRDAVRGLYSRHYRTKSGTPQALQTLVDFSSSLTSLTHLILRHPTSQSSPRAPSIRRCCTCSYSYRDISQIHNASPHIQSSNTNTQLPMQNTPTLQPSHPPGKHGSRRPRYQPYKPCPPSLPPHSQAGAPRLPACHAHALPKCPGGSTIHAPRGHGGAGCQTPGANATQRRRGDRHVGGLLALVGHAGRGSSESFASLGCRVVVLASGGLRACVLACLEWELADSGRRRRAPRILPAQTRPLQLIDAACGSGGCLFAWPRIGTRQMRHWLYFTP